MKRLSIRVTAGRERAWAAWAALKAIHKIFTACLWRCVGDPIVLTDVLGDHTSSDDSGFGRISLSPAIHTYKVGSRKMLISSAAISPPTITIAKGRCESEPIPCEVAAGSNPSICLLYTSRCV